MTIPCLERISRAQPDYYTQCTPSKKPKGCNWQVTDPGRVRNLQLGAFALVFACIAAGCSGTDQGSTSGQGGAQAGGALGTGGNGVGGTTPIAATGGIANAGGGLPTGGALGSGGNAPGAGGLNASGGAPANGGSISTGGTKPTGGAASTGGNSPAGGNLSTGGSKAGGGTAATGGNGVSTGGSKATGGAISTGGTISTGGSGASGGATSTGGAPTTGGSKATGGTASTGGSKATGGAGVGGSTSTHTGPWKIMMLGDSITATTCYPQLLWQDLGNAGHTNFTFIGSIINNQSCGVTAPAGGFKTEGHSGELVETDTSNGSVLKWFQANPPDIVVMHFATNDVWGNPGQSKATSVLNAYTTVLANLKSVNPNAIMFVAQIIPVNPSPCSAANPCNYEALVDSGTPAWATAHTTAAMPIYVVNLENLYNNGYFPNSTFTSDGVHPNKAGSQPMADTLSAAMLSKGLNL